MSYDMYAFYRPVCDWPDCGIRYEGIEYNWWPDKGAAREEVADNPWWLVLDDDDQQSRFFCHEHLLMDRGGNPARFDPDDDKGLPRNAELIPYYFDGGSGPLPKPECEDTIREILKGDGK